MRLYNVFVNVPHAFARVKVQADNVRHAGEVAIETVQKAYEKYDRAFKRWSDDESGKVPYPKKPIEWTAVVTVNDIARLTVEQGDVEIEEEEG